MSNTINISAAAVPSQAFAPVSGAVINLGPAASSFDLPLDGSIQLKPDQASMGAAKESLKKNIQQDQSKTGPRLSSTAKAPIADHVAKLEKAIMSYGMSRSAQRGLARTKAGMARATDFDRRKSPIKTNPDNHHLMGQLQSATQSIPVRSVVPPDRRSALRTALKVGALVADGSGVGPVSGVVAGALTLVSGTKLEDPRPNMDTWVPSNNVRNRSKRWDAAPDLNQPQPARRKLEPSSQQAAYLAPRRNLAPKLALG